MPITVNVKNRQSTFDELERQINQEVEQGSREENNRLIRSLREETPVDTGRARSGWRIEDGYFLNGVYRARILNDVPYIARLNQGTSSQAPARFIERTVLREGYTPSGTIVENR